MPKETYVILKSPYSVPGQDNSVAKSEEHKGGGVDFV